MALAEARTIQWREPSHVIALGMALIVLLLPVVAWGKFLVAGGGQYIDGRVLVLQTAACLLTLIMTEEWRRRGHPLILVLIVCSVVFYFSRPTLLLFEPYSGVLQRHPAGPLQVAGGLLAVFVGVACLYAGILASGRPQLQQLRAAYRGQWRPAAYYLGLAVLTGTLGLLFGAVLATCDPPPLLRYILVFEDDTLNYLLGFFLLAGLRDHPRIRRTLLWLFVFILATFSVAGGSRGGLFRALISGLMFFGIYENSFRVPLKTGWIVLLLTLAITLFPLTFAIGNHVRHYPLQHCASDVSSPPSSNAQPSAQSNAQPRAETRVQPRVQTNAQPSTQTGDMHASAVAHNVFERLGGLDNTIDLIAHRDAYGKIISWTYYFKSAVDGMVIGSLFGRETLRASIMLKTVYAPQTIDTVYIDSKDHYQSDLITPYAEFVILAGWSGLVFLSLVAGFVFGKCWIFASSWKRATYRPFFLFWLINVWWNLLNSFGLDWAVLNMTKSAIVFFVSAVAWNYLADRVSGARNDVGTA